MLLLGFDQAHLITPAEPVRLGPPKESVMALLQSTERRLLNPVAYRAAMQKLNEAGAAAVT